MLLEQFFDQDTSTFTYLIADTENHVSALIDPVQKNLNHYLTILENHKLSLKYTFDTHTHADHISANGSLREATGCLTLIGKQAKVPCIDRCLNDGDQFGIGNLELNVLHTPGHTDDSHCFYICNDAQSYLFTGDTLLINGTGRTDFQNGDAGAQYDSIFKILLRYPDKTKIYPGHDYNGRKFSTIEEQKRHNPRLQVNNKSDYVKMMNNLELPSPKYMDIAIPANLACGKNL